MIFGPDEGKVYADTNIAIAYSQQGFNEQSQVGYQCVIFFYSVQYIMVFVLVKTDLKVLWLQLAQLLCTLQVNRRILHLYLRVPMLNIFSHICSAIS